MKAGVRGGWSLGSTVMSSDSLLAFSFLFRPGPHGMVPPTLRVGLPPQLTSLETPSQRSVFLVILDPVVDSQY